MQLIYNGLKESILIQSLLLYWSIYGIYIAIIKDSQYNKVIYYKVLNKKDRTIIRLWYCGKQNFILSSPLDIIVRISKTINKIIVRSNGIVNDLTIKNNRMILAKKQIRTNDLIEIELQRENNLFENVIEHKDTSSFELIEKGRKSIILVLFMYIIFVIMFFSSISSLVSSFVDVKWDSYYLLEDKVKQSEVNLGYEFENIYENIYNSYDNIDERNIEIAVAIRNKYGKDVPLVVFDEIEEEILENRVQRLLECICILIILIFLYYKCKIYVFYPDKSEILENKYLINLLGDRIYFSKYKSK